MKKGILDEVVIPDSELNYGFLYFNNSFRASGVNLIDAKEQNKYVLIQITINRIVYDSH